MSQVRKAKPMKPVARLNKPPTCPRTNKVSYRDKAHGQVAIARFNRHSETVGFKLERIYRCEFCRFWHATSMPLQTLALKRTLVPAT